MKKVTIAGKKLSLHKKHIFTLTPAEARTIAGGAKTAVLITMNKICDLQSSIRIDQCGTQIIITP